ncbi:MAG: hypothetical protein R2806_02785 [Saprospiraceae bacterium]
MKRLLFSIAGLMALMTTNPLAAQKSFSIPMSGGTLKIIDVNEVVIEGGSGSEVKIVTDKEQDDADHDRAEGLRRINSIGQSDNTGGIGLFMEKSGTDVTLTPISKMDNSTYTVTVPAGVKVYYEHSTYNGRELVIRNNNSEIEANCSYNSVILEDTKSPLTIKTVYGRIEGNIGQIKANDAITLHSTYALVDVAIPGATKANVQMKTSYGEMYTDFNLTTEKSGDDMDCLTCKDVTGKINGGGSLISLKSTYSNIYLRKK